MISSNALYRSFEKRKLEPSWSLPVTVLHSRATDVLISDLCREPVGATIASSPQSGTANLARCAMVACCGSGRAGAQEPRANGSERRLDRANLLRRHRSALEATPGQQCGNPSCRVELGLAVTEAQDSSFLSHSTVISSSCAIRMG